MLKKNKKGGKNQYDILEDIYQQLEVNLITLVAFAVAGIKSSKVMESIE